MNLGFLQVHDQCDQCTISAKPYHLAQVRMEMICSARNSERLWWPRISNHDVNSLSILYQLECSKISISYSNASWYWIDPFQWWGKVSMEGIICVTFICDYCIIFNSLVWSKTVYSLWKASCKGYCMFNGGGVVVGAVETTKRLLRYM